MHVHDPGSPPKKAPNSQAERRLAETVQILTCIQQLMNAVYRGDTPASAKHHSALAHLGLELRFLQATPAMREGGKHE